MKLRVMGNTGIQVSPLGFGTMRLPEKDGKIDRPEAIKMIRWAIDNGLNYVDTAYPYHAGESEIVTGLALQDGYREKVSLATKYPIWKMEEGCDLTTILAEQLQKLQTDHIDFYMLHAVSRDRWENLVLPNGIMQQLLKAKEEGKVRHIGFSFHDDLTLFKEMVDYWPHWDFCQIQLNYVDKKHQAGIEGLEYAASKGLGVVIMEPLRGGYLARLPEQAEAIFRNAGKDPVEMALDFLWDRPEVSLLLSGMSTMEQVQQNMAFAEKAEVGMLTEEDHVLLEQAEGVLRSFAEIPCTGCNYCSVCPQGIAIPQIFTAYNKCRVSMELFVGRKHYREAAQEGALGDACIGCGACEAQCPQGISIHEWMPKIHELFKK